MRPIQSNKKDPISSSAYPSLSSNRVLNVYLQNNQKPGRRIVCDANIHKKVKYENYLFAIAVMLSSKHLNLPHQGFYTFDVVSI